jgi:hypothetical protein
MIADAGCLRHLNQDFGISTFGFDLVCAGGFPFGIA